MLMQYMYMYTLISRHPVQVGFICEVQVLKCTDKNRPIDAGQLYIGGGWLAAGHFYTKH